MLATVQFVTRPHIGLTSNTTIIVVLLVKPICGLVTRVKVNNGLTTHGLFVPLAYSFESTLHSTQNCMPRVVKIIFLLKVPFLREPKK